jgi:hypothetical protein
MSKYCYISCPYAAPTVQARRAHLARARELARWSEAQGYAVVSWWASLDPEQPPSDADPAIREAAMTRALDLVALVAAADGDLIMPAGIEPTAGMYQEYVLWRTASERPVIRVMPEEVGR